MAALKTTLTWLEGMKFEALASENKILMDAKTPLGSGSAQTPKELLAAGLGGCTAMDVVAILKKKRQNLKSLHVSLDLEMSQKGYPAVFTSAKIIFEATGEITPEDMLEAVTLSQTKYCGVSAMLSKAFPISYEVFLNTKKIGDGVSKFEI